MRSLFCKIFLWFWLATILVAGVFIGIDVWDQARGRRAPPLEFLVNSISLHGQCAADRWERGGHAALAAYCAELEQKLHLDGVLFDSGRVELSGRPAPAKAAEMAVRVLDSGQTDTQRAADGPLIAAPVNDSAGRRYAFVVALTRGPLGELLANPSGLLRRLGAVVLTAAVVCYVLARYLAAPIRRLRAATRRLAQGDLAVRVGPLAGHRRDELGELGCDFDFMAERLESLVVTQRRLLRDISHELRSPLARLNVALELGRGQQAAGAGFAGPHRGRSRALGRAHRSIARTRASGGQRAEAGAHCGCLEPVGTGGRRGRRLRSRRPQSACARVPMR